MLLYAAFLLFVETVCYFLLGRLKVHFGFHMCQCAALPVAFDLKQFIVRVLKVQHPALKRFNRLALNK